MQNHIFPKIVAQLVKNPPGIRETWVQSLGWEDPLEKGKATHSSILAWRTPWIIYSVGLQRVGHDSFFHFTFTFTFIILIVIYFILLTYQVNLLCVCVCQCYSLY